TARMEAISPQRGYIGNHQLESRMREIRMYGSEGGVAQLNALSLPLSFGSSYDVQDAYAA
ncbi:MAG: hypothetical protein ABIJ42_04145, partial [Acidobacteriota bacterium]